MEKAETVQSGSLVLKWGGRKGVGSPWAASNWVWGLRREKGSLQLENAALKNVVGPILLKLSSEQMQSVRKWQQSQSKPSCGEERPDSAVVWEIWPLKTKCNSTCSPSPSPLPFVFSSQNHPFFLGFSFFFLFFIFTPTENLIPAVQKNLWNKYLGCITNQLSFVFHFLWQFTSASLPGFIWRGDTHSSRTAQTKTRWLCTP